MYLKKYKNDLLISSLEWPLYVCGLGYLILGTLISLSFETDSGVAADFRPCFKSTSANFSSRSL